MKKIILLLSVILVLSCSKSDDAPTYLPLTYQNLVGKWNFKSVIRTNGTVVPFVGQCPTKTDYIEVFNYGRIITYNYSIDCITSEDNGCGDYTYDSNNTMFSTGPIFNDARVTELTTNGFKIEYSSPKALGFMIDVNDAKVIVFEKR